VWENGNPDLVDDIKSGAAPQVPVQF